MSRNVYRNIVRPERYFILGKTGSGRANGIELVQIRDGGGIAMFDNSEENVESFLPPNGCWKYIGDLDAADVLYKAIQDTLLNEPHANYDNMEETTHD